MQYFGEGKEYYENGHLKFLGTYRKSPHFFYGARCYVKGKLFYEDGGLRYEGTFTGDKNYEFNRGVEYKPDGDIIYYGNCRRVK